MKHAVVAALVSAALSASPGFAVPAIPFARPITAPVYGPAPGGRGGASAASDGTNFLVAWDDRERGSTYAARVGVDGAVLDPTGIRIAAATSAPFVLWGGDAYLLLWSDGLRVFAARIGRDGTFVDDPHAVLDMGGIDSVATNGSRVVAVYRNRIAVLDMSGKALESGVFDEVPGQSPAAYQVLANGSGFLLWWNWNGLYTMRLDSSGHRAGGAQWLFSAVGIAAASNGVDALFIVQSIPNNQRIAVRWTPFGAVDAHPFSGGVSGGNGTLVWNGSHYVHSWSEAGGTYAVRFDANATAVDAPIALNSDFAAQTLAAGGNRLLLTWVVATGTATAIKSEIVTDAATLPHTTPAVVSLSAAQQLAPRIAWSGRNYLLVWEERGGIWAARMDTAGRSLDVDGIQLSPFGSAPNVVFDGASFVVAWLAGPTANTSAFLVRIDPDSGARLHRPDPESLSDVVAAPGTACSFDLASNLRETMLATSGCGQFPRVSVMRFNQNLQPLDIPMAISPLDMWTTNPSVAWNGTQWLVAFEEVIYFPSILPIFPTPSRGNIRAVRISSGMTPLDIPPLVVASSDDDPTPHRAPHAAASGDDFLIAWTRGKPAPNQRSVMARHLLPNGTLGSAIAIGTGINTSAIWTGTRYALGFTSPANDAVGVTLGHYGDTTPSAMFKIEATTDDEDGPALIATGDRITGAYTRQATEDLYGGVRRVFVRDARPLHGRAAGR